MKNYIIIGLLVVLLLLIIRRRVSGATPSPAPAPVPTGTLQPEPGQVFFFLKNATDACPPGYSKPAPEEKPKICKIN